MDQPNNHIINKELEKAGIRFYNTVEEQEKGRLKEAIHRSDKEKFDFLMNLMKMQQKFK